MYNITVSNSFNKDVKQLHKRKYKMALLLEAMEILKEEGKLPSKYEPHKLSGNYSGFWEAHIKGDWLIIWDQDDEGKTIHMTRTGTHSDLFG